MYNFCTLLNTGAWELHFGARCHYLYGRQQWNHCLDRPDTNAERVIKRILREKQTPDGTFMRRWTPQILLHGLSIIFWQWLQKGENSNAKSKIKENNFFKITFFSGSHVFCIHALNRSLDFQTTLFCNFSMALVHSEIVDAFAMDLRRERTASLITETPWSLFVTHSPHDFSRWKSQSSTILS